MAELDEVLGRIEKMYGKGAVVKMSDKPLVVDVISTGLSKLDRALGIGGIPRGRVSEIFGPPRTGKSTLAMYLMMEAQLRSGPVALIDTDHAFDLGMAKSIGVKGDSLLVAQPDSGEQALEITDTLVRSGAVALVVIDSTRGLISRAEIEGDPVARHEGLHARIVSQAMRKLTAAAARTNTAVVFVTPTVTAEVPCSTVTGTQALKFYSSVRVKQSVSAAVTIGQQVIGHMIKSEVVKNKLAPPFAKAEWKLKIREDDDDG